MASYYIFGDISTIARQILMVQKIKVKSKVQLELSLAQLVFHHLKSFYHLQIFFTISKYFHPLKILFTAHPLKIFTWKMPSLTIMRGSVISIFLSEISDNRSEL